MAGSVSLAAVALSVAVETAALAAGFDQSCVVSFNMDQLSPTAVGHLDFSVDYPPARVSFNAATGAARCESLVVAEHTAVFSSDDSIGRLRVTLDSTLGFATFTGLASCRIWAFGLPEPQDFAIALISELDSSGVAVLPPVPVGLLAVDCAPLVTTTTIATTTTTASTTTSTTVPVAWCSRPVSRSSVGDRPVASDCLFILRAAVGLQSCSPECICRPTGNLVASGPTASDALLCLTLSVGGPGSPNCPCAGLHSID